MADINQPELPRQTVDFIRDHFGAVPFEVLENAIDYWLSGKIPSIRKPSKITVLFISLVLRDYIETFRHIIKMKPRKMLEQPKDENSKWNPVVLRKNSYDLTYNDFMHSFKGGVRLQPYSMAIIGKQILEEKQYEVSETEIMSARSWLMEYETYRKKKLDKEKLVPEWKIQTDAPPAIMSKIDMIAIAYVHFLKRIEGTEKPIF
jgi:hypothetical protein